MTTIITWDQWKEWLYDALRKVEAFPPPPPGPTVSPDTGAIIGKEEEKTPDPVPLEGEDNNPPEPPDWEDPEDR